MERKKRHRITFLLVVWDKVGYLISSFDSQIHPYSLDYVVPLCWGHVLAQKKYFLHFRLVFSLICISLSKKDNFSFCICGVHALSLLHGLCNPIQRLLYCVKGNLVWLNFEYKKRMILSVHLLKMSCYLHLVPAVFWKISPIQGTSTSWRNQKKPHKVQREVQSPAPGKEQPHTSL